MQLSGEVRDVGRLKMNLSKTAMVSPGAASKSNFNWSKIHLVYFALAAFDLLAITTGLALSEWSKSAHQHTVDKLGQINFLREELRNKQAYVVQLSGAGNDLLAKGDVQLARQQLRRSESDFGPIFSANKFSERAAKAFHLDTVQILDENDSKRMANVSKQLTLVGDETVTSFENFEHSAATYAKTMIAESRRAIDTFSLGDEKQAGMHLGEVNSTFRQVLFDANRLSASLDKVMEATVSESEATLKKSAWLQYIVGAAMLAMITMACTYAFFVGKLLKKKYEEMQEAHHDLQLAHKEAEEFSGKLQVVNNDVSKLNVDLADNLNKLKAAQDELIKKGRMEQLGQLTATVAHELRNPLGAVRTSAFLVERKTAGKGYGIEPQLQRIGSGIARCDNIITQLLDFSRSSKLTTKPEDLDRWLEGILAEEAVKLPANVTVKCDLGLGGIHVPFDPPRLQRAIVNLLSNASEAMLPKGDASVPQQSQQPHILVSTLVCNGAAEISVTDNGPGMTVEVMEKIREPLFTTKSFGTGLGVPAIEQIATQHGGSLDIISMPGKGATFTMKLPLTPQQDEQAA